MSARFRFMPKPPRGRPLLALAAAAALAALACVAAAPGARAGTAPYYPNWPGNLTVLYNQQPLPADANAVIAQDVPPIGSEIASAFGVLRNQVCTDAEQAIGYSHISTWDSCTVPDGELWAVQLSATQIGLRYTVPGISLSFDYAAPTSPTIHVSGDLEADVVLNVGGWDNGASTSAVQPLEVSSATVSFSNASIWTHNLLANVLSAVSGLLGGSTLSSLASSLDTTADVGGQISGEVAAINTRLHTAAALLAWYEYEPGANENFTFSASLDQSGGLTVSFGRGPLPGDCVSVQPQTPYGLAVSCGPDGASNALQSDVDGTWYTVDQDGDYLFYDPAEDGNVTWRVCGTNAFGSGCSAPSTSWVESSALPSGGGGGGDSDGRHCGTYCLS